MNKDVEDNIQANKDTWGKDWPDDGESWSTAWGDTVGLWHDLIGPALNGLVPTGNMLEIAVGYGRISQILAFCCTNFYGIDLNENCVEYTRNKLRTLFPPENIALTDGLTIPFDVKFDLVFSWDSLVHCHPDIVMSYIDQASNRLDSNGAIVLHHSTFASSGAPVNPHWRNEQTDAKDIAEFAKYLGLKVEQKIFDWDQYPTDCITTLRWK